MESKNTSLPTLQVLGGRICHDLAAPIGALAMGLEMLRDYDLTDPQKEVLSLVEQSLASARTKLELFRFLVGYKQSEEKPHMLDIAPHLKDLWQNSRYTFSANGHESLKGLHARLALALVLMAGESLPRGGEIGLVFNAPKLYVSITGTQASLSEEAKGHFKASSLSPQASDVYAWYAQAIALRLGCRLEHVQNAPDHYTLSTTF